MKIAMIGHKRIPSREGGIEIVVEELSTRMVLKGHEVDVYNRKGNHVAGDKFNIKNIKEYNGVRIISVPTFKHKSLNAMVYSFLATIRALFGRYDIIHFHAEGPCVMLFIAHLFGKKTIATIHGLDWQRAKWGGFASKYILLGEKMAVKYADEIIVLSRNVKEYFRYKYRRDVVYIENGVNIPQIKGDSIIKEKYGIEKGSYILFLARLVPEKGLHYLIEAYNKVETDKKLVIAGGTSHSDEYIDNIKKMVENNDNIIMTGFVQGEILQELYSNAFLYVLPSDVEGMPLSMLEAMSYGRRCLVSDVPENVEAGERYVDYFRHSNVESLKQILMDCLKRGYTVDEEVIEYVRKKYDWNVITDKTLDVYKHVLEDVRR